jgi:uncharacterized protein (TIGR02266 family)
MLREYARLEKKRGAEGLSLRELQRWNVLDDALRKEFKKEGADAAPDERRTSRRVATLLSVHFQSLGEARHSLMTNFSKGGVFIYTETPAAIGTRVELKIRIDESNSEIVVPAEVVTQNMAPDMSSTSKGMGLRFLDMDEKTRKMVNALYGRAVVKSGNIKYPDKA